MLDGHQISWQPWHNFAPEQVVSFGPTPSGGMDSAQYIVLVIGIVLLLLLLLYRFIRSRNKK